MIAFRLVPATLVVLAACAGGSASPSTPTTPSQTAHEYAIARSGGDTTGCSQAAPGEEAEKHPGCIYAAAFAGCLEGLTGEPVAPLPPEVEWAEEPALIELHHQAAADCTAT